MFSMTASSLILSSLTCSAIPCSARLQSEMGMLPGISGSSVYFMTPLHLRDDQPHSIRWPLCHPSISFPIVAIKAIKKINLEP